MNLQYRKSPHTPYNIKISTMMDVIDQKRGQFEVRPGQHLIIRVTPKVTDATENFKTFDVQTRNCRLQHETTGFNFLRNYSKAGCEMECAMKDALDICKCLPWFYTNNFTMAPMCDMFGAKCFDLIMSDETHYKNCSEQCLENCESTSYVAIPFYLPLNIEEICAEPIFVGLFAHFSQLYKGINKFAKITGGQPLFEYTEY